MMPFTAMVLSSALLDESIDYRQWLGGFLVIIGMVLIGTEDADASSAKTQNTRIIGKEQVKE